MTWLIPATLGLLAGAGLLIIIHASTRHEPRLSSALARLAGTDRAPVIIGDDTTVKSRLGAVAQRRIRVPAVPGISPTRASLDLVGRTSQELLGEKILMVLTAVIFGSLLAAASVMGLLPIPPAITFVVTVVLAAALWFVPDLDVKSRARDARADFGTAVAAYLELLVIERIAGSGANEAINGAASVAGGWPFKRIARTLQNAKYAGVQPWTALHDLGDELEVPELHEVADIMELAGREDATVLAQLRARARAMRGTQLSAEHTRANEDSTKMVVPSTFTALVFMLMLLFPLLMKTFIGT